MFWIVQKYKHYMNRIFIIITLMVGVCCTSAQQIWHKPDSTITLPSTDSIMPAEEYTIVAVIKSLEPDSIQLLWGIRSNDTLQSAFLTNAYFSCRAGFFRSQSVRDYSKWCVFYYHTGCRMDTTQSYALWLGPTSVYYVNSLNKDKDRLRGLTMSGEGVLLRLKGDEAKQYIEAKQATLFRVVLKIKSLIIN